MPTNCLHLHIEIEETGSIQFVAGDVLDTTHFELVCQNCGEVITKDRQLIAAHRIQRANPRPTHAYLFRGTHDQPTPTPLHQ